MPADRTDHVGIGSGSLRLGLNVGFVAWNSEFPGGVQKLVMRTIPRALGRLDPGRVYLDRRSFRADLDAALKAEGVKPGGSLKNAIESDEAP